MQYRTELHCHTREVSCCAQVTAEQMVEEHIRAGYHTVVLTNHLNAATLDRFPFERWETFVSYYLAPYHNARQIAAGRLHVLLGMELTFEENVNDYLIFGMTEEFLRSNGNPRKLGLAQFRHLAHESGMLIFQAHPFRFDMTIMNPALLDGIEVCNNNKGHDSNNAFALRWAEKFGLLQSSGSDYHRIQDIGTGGILTDEPIPDNETLLRVLRSNPKLIGQEP